MTSKPTDSSSQVLPQGDNAALSGPLAGPPEHQGSRTRNQVFKSGPLFISSKGIGWTSWKKRWFILTRTSLVFFRSDPGAAPQKGGEMNLTLGGIDLNNSASVEVKVDKKLLTVFFPDGRDGRAFTLKAETLEDLLEWKTALENALQLAPSATHGAGQNGLPKNELTDAANGSADQQMDKPPSKSMVIGRPILLALEDIDGSPSFLEKALRFIEDHGSKVEGVLRQAADVDDVHRRVREYEQGKTEFSAEEDAHIIGDCIKYILRELPSSPVPATCCNALLEAFRSDRNNRLNAMRTAILETFPEPNRRLLQRILLMMQTVASNQTVNRMSTSAVAACMSPLLLRPLLAGDCELENTHMDVAGDGSLQLLQAAAAANHAQAIIITLLDEYDNIFGEGSMSGALFSDSDESGSGTEEASDDGSYDEDDYDDDDDCEDDDHEYASGDHDEETDGDDDDDEHSVIETCSESDGDCSESGDHAESDSYDEKASRSSSFSKSSERANNHIAKKRSPSSSPLSPAPRNRSRQGIDDNPKKNNDRSVAEVDDFGKARRDTNIDTGSPNVSASSSPQFGSQNSSTRLRKNSQARNPKWGRTAAKRNLSMESIDFSLENEDDEIQRLEDTKTDLQNKIAEEANGNAILQASLERRKKALYERRLALEKDVSRLQEQLQKEKDLRAALESNTYQVPSSAGISEKTKNDLQEIAIAEENFNNLKQRFDDLGSEISREREYNAALLHNRNIELQDASFRRTMLMNNKDNEMKGTPNHIEKFSRDDRNNSMERGDCDNEGNKEPSLSNKNLNQPNDASQADQSKFGGIPNISTSFEAVVMKSNPSTRKSSSKGEGGSSTSALSKLTNRLNFLKERRNQIASELQNLDKGKGSSNQPALSPGKGKAPELPINPSTDKHSSGGSIVQNQDSSTNGMSTEGDNNNDKKKNDNKSSSNSRSDAPSYSSGKGMPNEGDRTEGDNKDYCKRSDKKRSSNSKPDAPSSYSSGKETSNEGDTNDSNRKNDHNKSNEGDNKDGNRKGFSSKPDAPISQSSVKAGSTDGNSNEYNRKSKNKDGNKKGSSSKTDSSSQNLDQSSHHLDRLKSEGQSSRSSDKGRQQDGAHNSSTSRTLSSR
ncbi:rho GTPase-activating protein REN1-like isoform X2 [Silene latifolia]|uniref:rho GTPase-activating protein REN1-like isoform X2 n=1 Tax=Silene latifolia TaxID=37657 RepID=UPI003D777BE1